MSCLNRQSGCLVFRAMLKNYASRILGEVLDCSPFGIILRKVAPLCHTHLIKSGHEITELLVISTVVML